MDITEFMSIALGGVEAGRVEVTTLEPGEVGAESVAALSQVIAELVDNGAAFSAPDQTVRVSGRFVDGAYVFAISDDGVGISQTMIEALNRLLARPPSTRDGEMSLGVTVVARLAAKHGLDVRLAPGSPGTTATVTVPAGVILPARSTPAPSRVSTLPSRPAPEPVFAPGPDVTIELTEDAPVMDVEDFLESIFAPLRAGASGRPTGNGRTRSGSPDLSIDLEPTAMVATLPTRVPGENFPVVEDEPSVLSSEAAIDLRSALAHFQDGRRDAGRKGLPDAG